MSALPPLVPNGEGLQYRPAEPTALARRMAQVWGVSTAQLLPTRGATHALELVFRRAALDGAKRVAAESDASIERLAKINRLKVGAKWSAGDGAVVVASPTGIEGAVLAPNSIRDLATGIKPAWLVVDERGLDLAAEQSVAFLVSEIENLVVLKSLSGVYGLAGARVGALIAHASRLPKFEAVLEPDALPTPSVRLAELALSPSRAMLVEDRVARLKSERARVSEALNASSKVTYVTTGEGTFLVVFPADVDASRRDLSRLGVEATWLREGVRVEIGAPEANDRLLAALGVEVPVTTRRRGEVVRDTKETKIACAVDLDTVGQVKVNTGVGFFDHMLDQVATHGGFSLSLSCDGDLDIDGHHTIEDCALAFGSALKLALGDRRGIARFGFVLPMDETEAKVAIDLGGRPFSVFKGTFAASHLGEYPTEMTAHVFRSLSESLGASIHVEVEGSNDHHKTEACFKALGRALRNAVLVEGTALPSTKGVI
jgi:imidazoleglycerol-phosphate dehydratase/histidinol-phosphatase